MGMLDLFSVYIKKVQKSSVPLEVFVLFCFLSKIGLKAEVADYFMTPGPVGIFLWLVIRKLRKPCGYLIWRA